MTGQQRDSLRVLSLDSAFRYRNHRLIAIVQPLEGTWIHSAIGDTVLAHGEKAYMTDEIVLDLYQQHLQRQPLDLAGALRRVSPEYVERIFPHRVSVDSVLLRQDLDGSNVPDQLVREARRQSIEVDAQSGASIAAYRLALYLDAAPLTSRLPAWSRPFDDVGDSRLERSIPLAGAGTLLVLSFSGADADETVIVLAWQGTAREVLHHQIDYGEGSLALRDVDGRIAVDATGTVQLGERRVISEIMCPRTAWPGSTLVYDASARGFVVERGICVPRQ